MMSFGSAHQTRVTEREGRRMRRRMFRKARGLLAYDEGLSSDDEPTEMDKVKFSNEKGRLVFFCFFCAWIQGACGGEQRSSGVI